MTRWTVHPHPERRSIYGIHKRNALTSPAGLWYLSAGLPGVSMSDTMGTFGIDFEVENPTQPGARRLVRAALVETRSELSWIPAGVLESLGIERYTTARFRSANGTVLERWTGTAWVHVAEKRTADDV